MTSQRPRALIGMLGTHTDVGKTYVAAQWLRHLRARGLKVAARKPVQSFDRGDAATDAHALSAATGEDSAQICLPHRNYPRAVAPPMAADLLQKPRIELAALVSEIHWPANIDVGLVETAGGPRSPVAHDGDSIDLVLRLRPDAILLVADAGLGTLNAVRLSIRECDAMSVTVFLNRFDADNELHRLNRQWLQEKYGITTSVDVRELDNLVHTT